MRKLIICAAALLVLACGGAPKPAEPAAAPAETTAAVTPDTTAPQSTPEPAAAPAAAPTAPGKAGTLKDTLVATNLPKDLFITIKVRDYGTMKVKFYTEDAPKNVTNVANNAIKGFYNGLTFHRIVPGFVVQGGDPKGDGTGGPGYTVPAEIKRKHDKGALAMARTGDQVNPRKESSGSQFYLCLAPLPMLDGNYTVIGQIVEGMDVMEKIGGVKTGGQDRPVNPVVMEQVTVSTN
ncbi:MAG: peptidylprolyl isomerase [bacterium]